MSPVWTFALALARSVPSPFSDQTSTLMLLDGTSKRARVRRADAAGGVCASCVCATVDRQGGSRTVPGLAPALFFCFAFSREGCPPDSRDRVLPAVLLLRGEGIELRTWCGGRRGRYGTARRDDTTGTGVKNVSASLATDRLLGGGGGSLATGGLIAKKTRTTRAGRGAADTYHAGRGGNKRPGGSRSGGRRQSSSTSQSIAPGLAGGGPPARHHWTPKQQQDPIR